LRKIANIAFEAISDSVRGGAELYATTCEALDQWISSKGIHDEGLLRNNFLLRDDRVANLVKQAAGVEDGSVVHWTMTEPLDSQLFETDIRAARSGAGVGITCELRIGAEQPGAPVHFEAHVPRVVRDVIGLSDNWQIAGTPVSSRALIFSGTQGGEDLARVLWHGDRAIPVVVVSDQNGILIAPAIHDTMARELAGVALVARADRSASWQLTALRGSEWSCYNGAIRLYYPRIEAAPNPRRHPLWTPRLLQEDADGLGAGATRLRALLRRLCMSHSAFSIYEPLPLLTVTAAVEAEARTHLQVGEDWELLANSYSKDNQRLADENLRLKEEVTDLRTQLGNLRSLVDWRQEGNSEEPAPADSIPPVTVEEAVHQASHSFADELVFGGEVASGVAGLAPDSGPPDKVLDYLKVLAELARARRQGPLGVQTVKWLQAKGISCSGESETVKNSKEERSRRTWNDGLGGARFYEMHLKPSEATSPDRCIRIYCEWDADHRKVTVGWIGRKPGL
jgi:hypothetical protein